MRRVAVYAVLAQALMSATWGQDPGVEQVWIVSLDREDTRRAAMHVRFQGSFDVPAPVVFEWEVATRSDLGRCTVLMTVVSPTGEHIFGGETELVLRENSTEGGTFTWDSQEIPLGEFRVHFQLLQASGQELTTETLLLNKFALDDIQQRLEEAGAAVASLRAHVAALESETPISPYVGMRLSIAEDFLAWARSGQLNSMELRHIAQYAARTVDSLRARMAFTTMIAEENSAWPDTPSLAKIQIQDGIFAAQGSPVFLAGMILNQNEPAQVERLARYGLNLAVVSRPHAEQWPSFRQIQDELDAVFEMAKQHNTSVAVQLIMPSSAMGAVDADAHPSAILKRTRLSTRGYTAYLSRQSFVHSLIIDRRPRFLLGGESVVASFRREAERSYVDRFTLNRNWRTRLASFDEVDIWRDYSRPSYQFDWQVFHRGLVTQHYTQLHDALAKDGPNLLTQVALSEDIVTPGGSQYGIGQEEVGAIFPVFGLAAQATPYGAEAQESGERILYTLARSINPGTPVFNTAHSPVRNRALHEGNLFEFVHARIWEGAMEGLSAIALTAPDPRNPGRPSYLNQPEALEGFATANLDINRLLDIVLAFQRAPAELAILWSDSSSIYEDGEAFLPSAANAYTGVSTSGLKVRFITESQCKNGELDGVELLIIPNTPAFDDQAMAAVETYVDQGKPIIRAAKPMPYNERGGSRLDVVRFGKNTLLVRGTGRVSEYLHAMDAALYKGYIPSKPRAINEYGYPQEGVRTRYIEVDGVRYLYIINLRTAPVFTHLFGPYSSGTDLIRGESISFPGTLQPLRPMLLRLDMPGDEIEGGGDALEIATPEINGGEGTSQGTRRVEVKPLD